MEVLNSVSPDNPEGEDYCAGLEGSVSIGSSTVTIENTGETTYRSGDVKLNYTEMGIETTEDMLAALETGETTAVRADASSATLYSEQCGELDSASN